MSGRCWNRLVRSGWCIWQLTSGTELRARHTWHTFRANGATTMTTHVLQVKTLLVNNIVNKNDNVEEYVYLKTWTHSSAEEWRKLQFTRLTICGGPTFAPVSVSLFQLQQSLHHAWARAGWPAMCGAGVGLCAWRHTRLTLEKLSEIVVACGNGIACSLVGARRWGKLFRLLSELISKGIIISKDKAPPLHLWRHQLNSTQLCLRREFQV